jgi:hypothetical protein
LISPLGEAFVFEKMVVVVVVAVVVFVMVVLKVAMEM